MGENKMIIRESRTITGKCDTVDVFLQGSGNPDDEHEIIGVLICQKLGIGKVDKFDKVEYSKV
jgi:hypothetical protein